MATRIGVGLGHRRPLIPITDGSRPLGKAAPDNRPEPPLTPRERRMADLFANATNGLPAEAITSALYGNYEPYATALRDAYLAIQPELADLILEEYGDAGTQTAEQTKTEVTRLYRRMGLFRKETITPEYMVSSFRFDRTSPQARRYAQSTASRLVTNTTAEGVETLRAVVTEAYTVGRTPQTLAQNLYTALNNQDAFQPTTEGAQTLARFFGVQAHGLTTRYEQAVVNRATTLANDLAARGITGEKAAKEIQKKSQAYADKLRRARSKTIARTELLAANNAGKLASMKEAVDQGLASRENSRKQWRTGRFDVCPICVNLHSSEPVPLDEDFAGRFAYPPAHPNCRCTIAFLPNIEHYQPGKPYGTNTPDDPLGIKPPDGGGITPGEPLPGLPEGVAPQAELVDVPAPAPSPSPLNVGVTDEERRQLEHLRKPYGDLVDRPQGATPHFGHRETRETAQAFDTLEGIGERAAKALDDELLKGLSPEQRRKIAQLNDEYEQAVLKAEALKLKQLKAEYEAFAERLDDAAEQATDPESRELFRKTAQRVRGRGAKATFKDPGEIISDADWRDASKALQIEQRVTGEIMSDAWGALGETGQLPIHRLRKTEVQTRNLLRRARKESQLFQEAEKAADEAIAERFKKLAELKNIDPRRDPAKVEAALLKLLEASRPGYGTGAVQGIFNKAARQPAWATDPDVLDFVNKRLPKEWAESMEAKYAGDIVPVLTSHGGYFQDKARGGIVAVSGDGQKLKSTLLHELTHVVESSRRGVVQAERLYYNRRATKLGGNLKRRTLYGSSGEHYYDLELGEDYAAKVYQDDYYELLTMGIERIFRGDIATMPPDYLHFVLGSLIGL